MYISLQIMYNWLNQIRITIFYKYFLQVANPNLLLYSCTINQKASSILRIILRTTNIQLCTKHSEPDNLHLEIGCPPQLQEKVLYHVWTLWTSKPESNLPRIMFTVPNTCVPITCVPIPLVPNTSVPNTCVQTTCAQSTNFNL